MVRNPPANAGDWVFLEIPGLQEGNGNPLQYSCLANPWAEEPGTAARGVTRESDVT